MRERRAGMRVLGWDEAVEVAGQVRGNAEEGLLAMSVVSFPPRGGHWSSYE